MSDVAQTFREQARGVLHEEAGVELLIRAGLVGTAEAWVKRVGEGFELDAEALAAAALGGGGYSAGQVAVIAVAASLIAGRPVDLSEVLTGLDRPTTVLVLAAIAHAAGSHQDSDIALESDGQGRVVALDSLYPWPAA